MQDYQGAFFLLYRMKAVQDKRLQEKDDPWKDLRKDEELKSRLSNTGSLVQWPATASRQKHTPSALACKMNRVSYLHACTCVQILRIVVRECICMRLCCSLLWADRCCTRLWAALMCWSRSSSKRWTNGRLGASALLGIDLF